ncbi:MAG: T9SS type A sorting domain-containing protein [Ignavibacteriaceae bacterium]|nr:T9SS type A sorting domain-containing protein [Ignavibacteriaceae bacterium]
MKGAWSTPVQYADNEPYYNKPALEYLGNRKFGVVYLSWINPVFRGAFFDLEDITPVDVQDDLAKTPDTYKLLQNYPNPFNPTTLIRYELPSQSFVTIKIYDALGNLVDELVNEEKSAGAYEVIFNASKLSSGVYFYSLQAGSFIQTNRMLLLR